MDDEPAPEPQARFRQLYDAHYGAVSAYARRRSRDGDLAQDAVAETFLVAWRRLAEVPAGADALPWLYGVARRVMANQRRSTQRRTDLSSRLARERGSTGDVDAGTLADEERGTVLAALGRLRSGDQEILRLSAWEELSHRQIALVLGCSEATVAVRLHRARNRLGKEIAKGVPRTGQDQVSDTPDTPDTPEPTVDRRLPRNPEPPDQPGRPHRDD
jgi:RNA polymerase sigma-70 factor (ECF subfamily)